MTSNLCTKNLKLLLRLEWLMTARAKWTYFESSKTLSFQSRKVSEANFTEVIATSFSIPTWSVISQIILYISGKVDTRVSTKLLLATDFYIFEDEKEFLHYFLPCPPNSAEFGYVLYI